MKKILLATALAVFAVPAFAQSNCTTDKEALVARLTSEQYSEIYLADGVLTSGHFMEMYVNFETGTFTVLMSVADGPTCVVAAGTDFNLNS